MRSSYLQLFFLKKIDVQLLRPVLQLCPQLLFGLLTEAKCTILGIFFL